MKHACNHQINSDSNPGNFLSIKNCIKGGFLCDISRLPSVLSPFFFILHTSYLYSESLASFLKYSDDVIIGYPCTDSQCIFTINNALKNVSDWSGDNGLNLNPNKCVQCMSFLKGNADTDPDLKANINGNTLSTVESVTHLGVTFTNNAKWTTHVEDIFGKCLRLFFFCKETELICKFAEACILPFSIILQPSSLGYLNTNLLCLSAQIN